MFCHDPVLITGSNGMIGSQLKLSYTNYVRFNHDKFVLFHSPFVKGGEIDLTNSENIERMHKTLKDSNCKAIIHCAAYCGTDKCESEPIEAVKSNILATQNVIYLANTLNIPLIYFSTTAINDPDDYMKPGMLPFDETAKIGPKTIYGLTKWLGENAVKQSMPPENYIVIKPVFLFGDAPSDNASMIRKIFERIEIRKSQRDRIDILPKLDVYLSPEYRKDYMHVNYFVEVFVNLLMEPWEKISGFDFVLCRGNAQPYSHYYKLIETITDQRIEDHINIYPNKDYLKDHVAYPSNFKALCNYRLPAEAYDDAKLFAKTHKSVVDYLKG